MKEYEYMTIMLPMNILRESGDYVLGFYFDEERFIANKETGKLYYGYEDEKEASYDWFSLTGERLGE